MLKNISPNEPIASRRKVLETVSPKKLKQHRFTKKIAGKFSPKFSSNDKLVIPPAIFTWSPSDASLAPCMTAECAKKSHPLTSPKVYASSPLAAARTKNKNRKQKTKNQNKQKAANSKTKKTNKKKGRRGVGSGSSVRVQAVHDNTMNLTATWYNICTARTCDILKKLMYQQKQRHHYHHYQQQHKPPSPPPPASAYHTTAGSLTHATAAAAAAAAAAGCPLTSVEVDFEVVRRARKV